MLNLLGEQYVTTCRAGKEIKRLAMRYELYKPL
jgi:hypothetical protein